MTFLTDTIAALGPNVLLAIVGVLALMLILATLKAAVTR